MKKLALKTEKTVIDYQTGEIVQETKSRTMKIPNEPDYVKLYVRDIGRMLDLPGRAQDFLNIIVSAMGYNNLFIAHLEVKKQIGRDFNMSIHSVNKYIDVLYKSGILIRKSKMVYLIDPNLFARGKWENIEKLRLLIEYDKKTGKRTIKSNIRDDHQTALNFSDTQVLSLPVL